LPWVLLGIRTAPKEDLRTSSAELVYGAPLTVPGDFVATPTTSTSPTTLLRTLHGKVQAFYQSPQPSTTRSPHRSPLHCIIANMYLSVATVTGHPWIDLMKVQSRSLKRGNKVFTIDRGGIRESIFIARLKLSHMDLHMLTVARPRRGHGEATARPRRGHGR
jgi:hypothetical protein